MFFAIGHSIGHFTRHNTNDPQKRMVLDVMASHKFHMFGKLRSYDENYEGMSLNLIIVLVAFAAILWMLSSVKEANVQLFKVVLWPIAIVCLLLTVTGFVYFFPAPAVSSLVAFVLLLWALIKPGTV